MTADFGQHFRLVGANIKHLLIFFRLEGIKTYCKDGQLPGEPQILITDPDRRYNVRACRLHITERGGHSHNRGRDDHRDAHRHL